METETNSRPVRRVAIFIVFIALLVLLAGLSIAIVKNVPSSFASLASLAESVRSFDALNPNESADDTVVTANNNFDEMLMVTSDTNVVENNHDVRLSWTDTTLPGSFVFAYECIAGVSLAIKETDGLRQIECGTNYNVGDRSNLIVTVNSERDRYVDVPYSVGFVTTESEPPVAMDDAVLTIVNEEVPIIFDEEATDVTTVTETEPASTPEATPAPSTPAPTPEETFTQEYTYTIPVSDPNGRIDLATRFIATGVIADNRFINQPLAVDEAGAIQFEVKNLGTKTSNPWTYTVTLPSLDTVRSDEQAPLKPNERALITIGFPASAETTFTNTITISTTGDNTSLNNQAVTELTFND